MKLNPDLWLLLTNIDSGGNIVFGQYCVSNPLVIQFQVSSRPCWCHVEAQSGPNVTAVSCYIVYTEDITRAHQCGSPSQLPGAQVTNWCRNWIAPQETWLPISIPLMEHNWRLALKRYWIYWETCIKRGLTLKVLQGNALNMLRAFSWHPWIKWRHT